MARGASRLRQARPGAPCAGAGLTAVRHAALRLVLAGNRQAGMQPDLCLLPRSFVAAMVTDDSGWQYGRHEGPEPNTDLFMAVVVFALIALLAIVIILALRNP